MNIRTILLAASAALLLAPAAAAHVGLHPHEAPAGSFARFDIRVPNEREDAATVKVTVRLPESLTSASFQPKPGWKRTVTMAKLAKPIEEHGETVTERIATVTWSGGRIEPGEFDEFGISFRMPEKPGTELVFPAIQTYSSGEVVRWIGPPDADEPASRVEITAAEEEHGASGASEEIERKEAAATMEKAAAAAEAAGEQADDAAGRANLALGLGIAGLVAGALAGLAGLGMSLRRRRAA